MPLNLVQARALRRRRKKEEAIRAVANWRRFCGRRRLASLKSPAGHGRDHGLVDHIPISIRPTEGDVGQGLARGGGFGGAWRRDKVTARRNGLLRVSLLQENEGGRRQGGMTFRPVGGGLQEATARSPAEFRFDGPTMATSSCGRPVHRRAATVVRLAKAEGPRAGPIRLAQRSPIPIS